MYLMLYWNTGGKPVLQLASDGLRHPEYEFGFQIRPDTDEVVPNVELPESLPEGFKSPELNALVEAVEAALPSRPPDPAHA